MLDAGRTSGEHRETIEQSVHIARLAYVAGSRLVMAAEAPGGCPALLVSGHSDLQRIFTDDGNIPIPGSITSRSDPPDRK
jgi:hypothetical protein